MKPAVKPGASEGKLLVLDSKSALSDQSITELSKILKPGDLVVVNDASTIPASLQAQTKSGEKVEIRLVQKKEGEENNDQIWLAILFGEGDWHLPTEKRKALSVISVGDDLLIGSSLKCQILDFESPEISNRLVKIKFNLKEEEFWSALYKQGRPIQYSYLEKDLELWDIQTVYSGKPESLEMPSAGKPLTWKILLSLKEARIEIATLIHAAGISSTGDEKLDKLLPLAEKYFIPERTVECIKKAKARGGRIVAIGTSVMRALESSYHVNGEVKSGDGLAKLFINASHRRMVVDALLTGIHEASESHYQLMKSFTSLESLERATSFADKAGYLFHEFGDSCLVFGIMAG